MKININWKSPSIIIFLCLLAVTIICFCLVNVAEPFAIIGSISMTLASMILVWKSFLNYLIFKRNIENKKATDAYLYAEQIGSEEAMKEFSYDKKTQRKIKSEKFNKLFLVFCFFVLMLCGIFLFLICSRIII